MKRKIVIEGLQVVSINSAYYADRKHGFKSEVKHWFRQIAHQLSSGQNLASITDIKNHFDEKKHCFHIMIISHTPKMFNKSGYISLQSIDCSNFEKLILDSVFEYDNSLGLDDKFVTRLISEKRNAPDFKIEIMIHVKTASKP